MPRKPINIATGIESLSIDGVGTIQETKHVLYALCDDGTIWELTGNTWDCLAEIPQDVF